MNIVEEARASITSIKNKDDMVHANIFFVEIKDDTAGNVEEPTVISVSNIPNEVAQLENITKLVKVIIFQENLDLSVLS